MKKCKECKKEIGSNRKFCSHSCSAKYANRRRNVSEEQRAKTSKTLKQGFLQETAEARKIRIERNKLAWQDEERRQRHSIIQRKVWSEKLDKIRKELPFEKWPRRTQRRELYKVYGNVCATCKYTYTDSKTNRGPFDVHHINGDNTNWCWDNLEILCLICHWKTGNFRFRGRKHTQEAKLKLSKRIK